MPAITEQEFGLNKPKPSPPGHLPPNMGKYTVPHFAAFAAVVNYASRSYTWTFDEAMRDSRTNAVQMRNDPIVRSALNDRVTPTCQTEWQIEPDDETNPSEVVCAEKLTKIIKKTPKLQQLKRSLLQALFYGRYGVQLNFEWKYNSKLEKEMVVKDWVPVNGDKIVFKFDGQPGILVNAAFFQGTKESTPRGLCHFFTPDEQECLLVHEFEPEDADFFEGIMSGGVHGVGFRGVLYWFYWLRNNLTTILMDFLQKVGTGITIFYYEAGNEESQAAVTQAAQTQIGNNVYLFPRNRDQQSAFSGPGIDRVEVSMQGADMFLTLFNMLNDVIRGYIMGETLTTDTAGTGMGSGVAEAHESTAERRTKYDAIDLDFTLQSLVSVLNKYNCPGNPEPYYKSIVDKPNVAEFMEAAQFFYSIGGSLDEDDTRKKLGLPQPESGHSILSKIQPMQPAAVGPNVPEGIPQTAPAVQGQGPPQQAIQGQTTDQGQGQSPEQQEPEGEVSPE